jgi:hypothetical protein
MRIVQDVPGFVGKIAGARLEVPGDLGVVHGDAAGGDTGAARWARRSRPGRD